MKRIFSLLLALLLLAGLIGCAAMEGGEAQNYDVQVVTRGQSGETQNANDSAPADTEQAPPAQTEQNAPAETEAMLDPDGWYDSKDEVALYLLQYGKLPGNYITKKEAEALGWPGGSLEPYAPGKSIGGSYFGNYEGLLPVKEGREYHECDIDTAGKKSRGAKRIVWSNDGLIYYTDDHYESFTLLYGEVDE